MKRKTKKMDTIFHTWRTFMTERVGEKTVRDTEHVSQVIVFNKNKIATSISKQQNNTSMNGLNEKNLRIF